MMKDEVRIGVCYRCKVSGKLATVKILNTSPYGGWDARNEDTGRNIRIKSAQRLKGLAKDPARQESVKRVDNPLTARLADRVAGALQSAANHVVVIALAGTGKTFTMIVGVAWVFLKGDKWIEFMLGFARYNDIPNPHEFEIMPSPEQHKVWDALAESSGAKSVTYCAFNKSIVTEFSERWGWLVDMLRQVGVTLQFATVNSLGYRACMSAFGRVTVTNFHVHNLLAYVTGRDIRELERYDLVAVKATEQLARLCKLTMAGWTEQDGFSANRVTDEVLDELAAHYDIDLNGQRDKAYEWTRQVLAESLNVSKHREIDFDDQNWLPVVLSLPVSQVDVLLVDEGQDLPRAKQEFCRKVGRRIVLVGDINQAIYGFAGADVDAIPRMQKLLGTPCPTCNNTGRLIYPQGDTIPYERGRHCPDCRKYAVQPLYLTETRRCSKTVVARANETLQQCYQHRGAEPLEFKAHENNGEGTTWSLSLEEFGPEVPPSEDAEQEVLDRYVARNVKVPRDGDMVLCRVNAPLISQALRFIKAGRKAVIRGRNFGETLTNFVKKLKAATVPDLLAAVEQWYTSECQKETRKRNPSEAKLIALEDRKACVEAFCEDASTVEDVLASLNRVFAGKACPKCNRSFDEDMERCPVRFCKIEEDERGYPCGPRLVTPKGVLFSSVHRAKGLEAQRVYLLWKNAPVPHPMAKSRWQYGQELNLKFVMETRAIQEIVDVV